MENLVRCYEHSIFAQRAAGMSGVKQDETAAQTSRSIKSWGEIKIAESQCAGSIRSPGTLLKIAVVEEKAEEPEANLKELLGQLRTGTPRVSKTELAMSVANLDILPRIAEIELTNKPLRSLMMDERGNILVYLLVRMGNQVGLESRLRPRTIGIVPNPCLRTWTTL